MSGWLGLPPDHSLDGHRIDFVIVVVHAAMVPLFVGWLAWLLWVLVRYRAGARPESRERGPRGRLALSVAALVAAAELLLLVSYEIPLWARRVAELPHDADVTRVRVVGEQFAWNVHYPGPDGVFGPTALERMEPAMNPLGLDYDDPAAYDDLVLVNQLHVPVDRAVEVELSSKDVIHSFYLPFMRVKQDAIPGQRIRVHFTPIVTGRSEIACAELCGLGHARMRGFLVVQTEQEFESWYREELEYQ